MLIAIGGRGNVILEGYGFSVLMLAARANGTSYALLMGGLAKANIEIDRKMLSDLAIQSPQEFTALVKQIQKHIDSVDAKHITR